MTGGELVPQVDRMTRDEFLRDAWAWRSGEHVTFLGPTGSGKTTLAFQLLQCTASVKCPAVVLAMKPRDRTVREFAKAADFRIVRAWPPPLSIWRPGKKRGYVVWPRHSMDPDVDDVRHYRVFRGVILGCYREGNKIIFADETYSLTHELGLQRELVTVWTKGRSMDAALWGASQKPTHVPLWMYDQAEHLFLAYDPDVRAQQRYGEIGGVDPDLVRGEVQRLGPHEWLYIRRRDRAMCVILR